MKKGVTFIELVVVLAIIGILAAVTVPTMKNYLSSWQLSGSARLLVNKLRQAQEEVVTTQVQHGVRFNTTTPVTIDFFKKVDTTKTTLETVTLSNGITIALNSLTDNEVIFSADGGLSTNSSPGTIIVTLGTSSKTISVSAAGVIKLQ